MARRARSAPPSSQGSAAQVRAALRAVAKPALVPDQLRFFKTGKGEYGEGDRFLGVKVPQQRVVARSFRALPPDEAFALLESPFHEDRLTALFILVWQFEHGDEATQRRILDGYLARTRFVNNWDLVDSSAHFIVGAWVLERPRDLLTTLVRSPLLWERRIAVIATLALIRAGEADDTLALCEALLDDEHDLIHKATGWMLREVGGRVGLKHLRAFLARHARRMPRTMLRYSIEKLPPAERKRWLGA